MSFRSEAVVANPLQVREKFTMKREILVSLIEKAFQRINTENKKRRWIAAAFKKCGQDPLETEDVSKRILEAHVQSLDRQSIYPSSKFSF